jgi:hypothetical protein
MHRKAIEALAFTLVAAAVCPAIGKAAPVLAGYRADPRCRQALEMARQAFDASSPSLQWPVPRVSRPGMKIILSQDREDISGGHALAADPAAFEAIRPGPAEGSAVIYRRKSAAAAAAYAVADMLFNWRGDEYSLYVLGPGDLDRLTRQLTGRQSGPKDLLEPALAETWTPPIVLAGGPAGSDWLIDRGASWDALADWQVHSIGARHLTSLCRISFGLPKGGGLSRLPLEVRALAAAADEALGPGSDEGTLQPTAGIRISVARGWANAALRPWAVRNTPYNSRSEVDRGLDAWARLDSRRGALRDRIARTRRRAEIPLASYYAVHFGKNPASARRLSRAVLDTMLRSYFVFPR